jgi:NAD(P)-dependent dehydrogenase (short-subunit alcohol dehydrogenase family)
MTGRLHGKVALITGTAGGMGRAAALLFAAEGATIVGTDVQADGTAETVRQVKAAGGRMTSTHPLDLLDETAVREWIDAAAQRYGGTFRWAGSDDPRRSPDAPCSSPATNPPTSPARTWLSTAAGRPSSPAHKAAPPRWMPRKNLSCRTMPKKV